jgi:hypothetical protein
LLTVSASVCAETGGPSPADYDDPIAWMDAVHSANRGRGLAMLNTVGTLGQNKLAENSPPSALRSLPRSRLRFGGVTPWQWTQGHYGSKVKSKRLTEEGAFFQAMDAFCRAKNGSSVETPTKAWACEDGAGRVSFVYLMDSPFARGNAYGKVVTADDPTMVLKAARLLAYLDPTERQAARQRTQLEAQMARSAEILDRQIQLEQAPKRRQVGHRLCQLEGQFLLVGFVERFAPETNKVQIRVVDKYLSDGGPTRGYIRPSGFQPGIIWDDPDRWRLCP